MLIATIEKQKSSRDFLIKTIKNQNFNSGFFWSVCPDLVKNPAFGNTQIKIKSGLKAIWVITNCVGAQPPPGQTCDLFFRARA